MIKSNKSVASVEDSEIMKGIREETARESIHQDKVLTCKDCGVEFTFTVGEQKFYQEKGFTDPPKRCSICRKANKANRQNNLQTRG